MRVLLATASPPAIPAQEGSNCGAEAPHLQGRRSRSVLTRCSALFELQVLYALEIQPVTLRSVVLAGDADQGVVARCAAHHRTYLAHVAIRGAALPRRAATDAGNPGSGDFEIEDLVQSPCRGVAVEPVFVHRYPPVGPKRSVLTRAGSWPSPTSVVATASTSGVGPHTKARGISPEEKATSPSICSSILRS